MESLNKKAWLGFFFVALSMGLLLFIPAGTLHYWQAWTYLAVYFGASLFTMLYLMEKSPALLARRVKGGPFAEKETSQKIIMLFTSILFMALYVVSALDFRFGWSKVPLFAVITSDILVALGFYIIFIVYKVNPFTAATIQVEKAQHVISTGPYALVRHPMYSGALLMLAATPPALGSWWGILVFIPMLPLLIWRLLHEENLLAKSLLGYTEYCKKVRWRLIPGIF